MRPCTRAVIEPHWGLLKHMMLLKHAMRATLSNTTCTRVVTNLPLGARWGCRCVWTWSHAKSEAAEGLSTTLCLKLAWTGSADPADVIGYRILC